MSRRKSAAVSLVIAMSVLASTVNAEKYTLYVSAFAAGAEGAIHTLQVESENGTLERVASTSQVEHPFFLALSPDRNFLYSIHATVFGGKEHEHVAAFRISADGTKLEFLNRQSARGTAACYLDVDAAGKTVVVANYSTGSVAALPIRKDGTLAEISTFVQHAGSSVNPQRQKGPHAHCLVIGPDSRFAYAADLGLDQVLAYRLHSDRSTMEPAEQPFVRTIPGAGPRHLTFHPNGKHLYVINELANSVTRFDYQAENGFLIERETVSTLPDDFEGESYCADVKITPDGKYLYGTNRGHDSLACYRLGQDGSLHLVAIEPSLGKGPQNLAITADGKLLLCANMPGDNLAVFRIDQDSGKLKSVGVPLETPSPSCIMIR